MAIKELYNEVKKEKKNKIKDSSNYSMPISKFIEEHKNLIKILREGSREELLAEAEKQEEELEKCFEDHGMSADDSEDDNEDDE